MTTDQGLLVEDVTVKYGGFTAVSHATFHVPPASIVGLIGPNGAGKTTTFSACSGQVQPSTGRVLLNGRDITSTGTARRARAGLGRTFQRIDLFDRLTVRENIRLGYEARLAAAKPWSILTSSKAQARDIDERSERALEACGITGLADRPAGVLTTGQRRLAELARVIAGDFDILLLDEPSSGLDHSESAAFGRILRELVAETGVGIFLVEHDMTLVRDVCERLYVLDFGKPIAAGDTETILASDEVRAAYLGQAAA
jgi:ABC-type branched-subunit amino acid transport system ATPase component